MGNIVNPVVIEKILRAEFMKAYENGEDPNDIMPFIMETESTTSSEKYGWLGNPPAFLEWTDERVIKGLLDSDYTLANKHYEATIGVDRDDLADDQLGAIKTRISDMAIKGKQHPRKLFFDALVAGTTDLCYDGQAFFSASHSEGASGTQSNLNGSGSGVTVANLKTDFIAARAAMRKFKDDQGEPLNEGELDLYVVIPPDIEGAFEELLNSLEISSTTNILKGAAKIISSSRLTDANDWYLINAKGNIKPFIKQKRQDIQFAALEENSDRGFMSKNFVYGADHRMGFGYGLWQKAYKVVNS